jgi:hypothetical protein
MQYLNCAAPSVNGALIIEHLITADDPFGAPWPPDGVCSIVRRARGFTLWRRIFLSSSTAHVSLGVEARAVTHKHAVNGEPNG